MKRITVEDVKAAYEKCRLAPVRGMFRDWEPFPSRVCGCCAQSALAAAAGLDIRRCSPGKIADWAADEYGANYAQSFRHGFDGLAMHQVSDDAQGYADGVAVAAAIFGETK